MIISIFSNCQSQSPNREMQNDYLPDLKVENIHYEYLRHSQPSLKPGTPKMVVIRPPSAIKFVISISNIGTEYWNHDLNIRYFFDGRSSYEQGPIVIEDLMIPYALNKEVLVEIKYPSIKPNSITFYLNTTKADSAEYYKIYDEFYYKNNSIKVKLD